MFRSFLQGGFEGSTHRRPDGRQLDLIAATRHDVEAATDYRLVREAGLRTVRDALRWHLVDQGGAFDWSSALPMIQAARQAGVQVIWDLLHYGLPHDIDIWSPAFVDRFAAFARGAARLVREETDDVPVWCAVNEISFWAWSGGDKAGLYPHARDEGYRLKRQLVRAAIAGIEAVRDVDGRARLIQAEPLINIVAHPERPHDVALAERLRLGQFQAWDMLAGRVDPALGGAEKYLDVVGVNFYFNNQWVHDFETMGMGHRLSRAFPDMLDEVHTRYGRPLMVSETGVEGANGPGWLRYVAGEVRTALRRGVPVLGLCVYPVMDYPGWDDERHCPCGLIRLNPGYAGRTLDRDMLEAIAEQEALLQPVLAQWPENAVAA